MYNTTKYIEDFNTIMYNLLIEQAMHNESLKIKELKAKLSEV